MSRTRKGSKRLGHEYWGRQPCSGYHPSKENKTIAHQIERARERELVRNEIEEMEDDITEAEKGN